MNQIAHNLTNLKSILRERFGFETFIGRQEEVLSLLAQGRSVLLLMPTGSGKSLCFQLPAALQTGGIVLVLSPLIALMDDQCNQAEDLGIRATFINSSIGKEERDARLRAVLRGQIQLLFVTPERFKNPEFVAEIKKVNVDLLAVDEAHCVSLWGHDFRPEYSKIHRIREILGKPVTLAMTATATAATTKDILEQVGIPEAEVVSTGFYRDNLNLKVIDVVGESEKVRAVIGLHHMIPGPKIVYCSLISSVQKLRSQLERLGIRPMVYHGELPSDLKRKNLVSFMESDDALLIATPAFGLGINKPNIRAVIHAEVPNSIEAYYQEVGRAGRDGLSAEGILLFDEDDVSIQREFLNWSHPEESFLAGVHRAMETQAHLLQVEGLNALKDIMSFKNRRDHRVESSLQILTRLGYLEESKMTKLGYAVVKALDGETLSELKHEARKKNSLTKLLEMVRYAQSKSCRMQVLMDYFGEGCDPCGRCDICLAPQAED